jgi:predicted thioesterase
MEAATVHAASPSLSVGQTTVGTAVRIEHRRATPVGGTVTIEAELSASPGGRQLTFMVRAIDDRGELAADGEIDRVVVDRERFLASTARDA